MSMFLTNPESPPDKKQLKGDWEFKEQLERELQDLGIPYYYARLATIDYKHLWIPCFKRKMTPNRTAMLFVTEIKNAYNISDTAVTAG